MIKDGVTTAFDIIIEEFTGVVNEVNDQGASFMRNGKYEDAEKLIESDKQLRAFREKLDSLRNEWTNGLDYKTRDLIKINNVHSLASHHKASRTRLRITLPNNKVIEKATAAETFALALNEMGLDRVRTLGKQVNKVALISPKKDAKYTQFQIGGFYIMTHSNTVDKKGLLDEIATDLGIKIWVEIVQ